MRKLKNPINLSIVLVARYSNFNVQTKESLTDPSLVSSLYHFY